MQQQPFPRDDRAWARGRRSCGDLVHEGVVVTGVVMEDHQGAHPGRIGKPLFARVFRWKGAMAQYGVGHLDRLQRIESLLQQLPGLALAGNGYRGIGVPDCILLGYEAANQVMLAVGLPEAKSHDLAS